MTDKLEAPYGFAAMIVFLSKHNNYMDEK